MFIIPEIQFVLDKEKDKIYIINLINAATSLINKDLYNKILNLDFNGIDRATLENLKKRRYLFETENEYKKFITSLEQSIEQKENESIPNFLLIPTYSCNLNCIYCYEKSYKIDNINTRNSIGIFNKYLTIIETILKKYIIDNNKDVHITLMGGEPLMKKNLELIEHMLKNINSKGYSINIVTNGIELEYFLDLLTKYNVSHIQITLDGDSEINDKRRIYPKGGSSFAKIIENLKLALEKDLKVYLRVNVDEENITGLPNLARILCKNFNNDKNLKPYIYLLQDGGCSGDDKIINENIGINKIYELENKNPEMKIFHKKYHPAKFLQSIFENKIYHPVMRHCGASKNQYIFDFNGRVYKCWHGIGSKESVCGEINDTIKFNSLNDIWKNRSTKNIKKCNNCKYRYICGTGCPAATHKEVTADIIKTTSCVDYETLINTMIINHFNR
ncbi:MAG: radical SAM protein [Bdellovibrionota bacterium]